MSFDSSSMDLGLRLASCLCEVGRGTFVSDNWGTNMRKMGFGRSRISLLPKGCTKWYDLWEGHEFDFRGISWGFLGMLRNTLRKRGFTIHATLSSWRTRGFWLNHTNGQKSSTSWYGKHPSFPRVLYRWCRIPSINSDITQLYRFWVVQWQAPLTNQSIWFYYVSNKWNLWTKTSWYIHVGVSQKWGYPKMDGL